MRIALSKVNTVNIEAMITVSTSAETYHHGSLRDALLTEGIAALEGGEGKEPSLRELARRVGVSATAVYRHFPDKQALNRALAREGSKLLGIAQKQAADTSHHLSTKFALTGRAYVRFALAHPVLFRLMFTQGEPVELGDEDPDPARELLTELACELSATREEAERLALQAWSIAHGIAMLMLDGRIPADDALIDRLLDTGSLFPVQGSSSEESP
ncbi:TetR/AcrR family transcriptional regulator [Qipengyuania sp. 902]|uniref:TetR/AcrR family transcriptional regulator n=1 Tax=Qipengyuania sp. 902 TaxID=3417565 RepID=UPI003EBF980C